MARAAHLKLHPGEMRVAVIRRHWWTVVCPLLWLAPVIALLPIYACLEFALPNAGLAQYTSIFLILDLGFSGLVLLRWLCHDVAAWYADRYLITTRRIIEQRGVVTVERREANLRAVQSDEMMIYKPRRRLLDYGDLHFGIEGRDRAMALRRIPQPRAVEALIAWYAEDARRDHRRHNGGNEAAIQGALTRIFEGGTGMDASPTVSVVRITSLTVRAQRRLRLSPDEAIQYVSRRHPVLLVRSQVLPIATGLAAAAAVAGLGLRVTPATIAVAGLLLGIWLTWNWLYWKDDIYVVTSDRVIELCRKPLLVKQCQAVQIREIQDVVLRISPLSGRALNMGTLSIEQQGADPVRLEAVPSPDAVQRLIFDGIDAAAALDRLREQEQLAGTLTGWFEEYHKMQSQPT